MYPYRLQKVIAVLLIGSIWCVASNYAYISSNHIPISEISFSSATQDFLESNATTPSNPFRLPDDVQPKSYQVRMISNLDGKFRFFGNVKIMITAGTDTSTIFLHSHKLVILAVTVFRNDARIRTSYDLIPNFQLMKITTATQLKQNESYTIRIRFKGTLNDDKLGFYRSKYTVDNKTKWLATTQFESTYARMAFPCFDEPRFRATFHIFVARYTHQKAISNMPLTKTSPPIKMLKNRVFDEFATTPPMPTYLVAFVVSEFRYLESTNKKFRVWGRENVINDYTYAFTESQQLLPRLSKFLGVPYDLPKMDLVAIPNFYFGAMENWGLTTYRDIYISCNEDCFTEDKQWITIIIAHEFAHQWFGNHVTLAWWDYLWLNEGFATYFEYFLTAMLKPKWNMYEKFIRYATHVALDRDGIFVHKAMNGKVNTPDEIMEHFNVISYQKAAAVIRMIENFLRRTPFQKALKNYLIERSNAGGVAIPKNLYDSLEAARLSNGKYLPLNLTIHAMMGQFANQFGYPLITVTRLQTNTTMNHIQITQSPYRSPRSRIRVPDQIWTVPIACTKKSKSNFRSTAPKVWSYSKNATILRNEVEENDWYICNIQQTGYYRVNYDKHNWDLINAQLQTDPSKIHPINKAQIIDDLRVFSLDNITTFSFALNLLSYLKNERDLLPWNTGIRMLYNLYTRYEATSVGDDLKRFTADIITDAYNSIGFNEKPTDSQSLREFRGILTMVSCHLDILRCKTKAKELYYGTNDLSNIKKDVRETVLCTAMRINSTIENWNRMWELYGKSHTAGEKESILVGIGCATNEKLLERYLFKLIDWDENNIETRNVDYIIQPMMRSYRGVTSSLKFVKIMLPNLREHKTAQKIVQTLLKSMNTAVRSEEHEHLLDELIFEANKLDQRKYDRILVTLRNTKEAVQFNIRENKRIVTELHKAISDYRNNITR